MKAGSTAKTFGVELEELVGHITAIGVATRESGNIVGNSLKTIYSRLTTMDSSIDALASIGISVKDSSDEMKSASLIIDELAKKWNTLSTEQQQNIAVSLAGR
jgi:TP901 family phage tail tape measure protein